MKFGTWSERLSLEYFRLRVPLFAGAGLLQPLSGRVLLLIRLLFLLSCAVRTIVFAERLTVGLMYA